VLHGVGILATLGDVLQGVLDGFLGFLVSDLEGCGGGFVFFDWGGTGFDGDSLLCGLLLHDSNGVVAEVKGLGALDFLKCLLRFHGGLVVTGTILGLNNLLQIGGHILQN